MNYSFEAIPLIDLALLFGYTLYCQNLEEAYRKPWRLTAAHRGSLIQ
jgi:hypothetical protein